MDRDDFSSRLYPYKYVPIPVEKKILIAIAIGYPDEQAVINRFRSTRETLENVVHWKDLT